MAEPKSVSQKCSKQERRLTPSEPQDNSEFSARPSKPSPEQATRPAPEAAKTAYSTRTRKSSAPQIWRTTTVFPRGLERMRDQRWIFRWDTREALATT